MFPTEKDIIAHSGEVDISFSSLMQDVMDKTATATATILQMVCFICLFVISTLYNTLYKKIVQNYELFFHLRKHSIFLTVFSYIIGGDSLQKRTKAVGLIAMAGENGVSLLLR